MTSSVGEGVVKKSRWQRAALGVSAMSLVVLSAPAARADAPRPTPLVVGGPAVTLGTGSSQGPLIGPGLHSTTIPARSQRNSFRVHRDKNETLHVGISGSYATSTWQGIGSSKDSFAYEYKTLAGDNCTNDQDVTIPHDIATGLVYSSLTISPQPTHMGDDLGANSAACRSATDFVLTVVRTVSGPGVPDTPTQISVMTTPQITGGSSKSSLNGLSDMSTSALDPTSQATPGRGWTTATALTPGGYSLNAIPGASMVFRVHLGWGQRMSVGWQLPPLGQKLPTQRPVRATLDLYSPTLSGTDLTDYDGQNVHVFPAGSSQSQDLGAYTAPIEDGNSDIDAQQDAQKSIWWQTMPGWYYIVAGIGPDLKDKVTHGFTQTASIPSTLSIRVEGQAQAGPTMAVKEPAVGSLSGRSEGSKVPPGVWGSITGLGVLVIAGVTWFLWRRSRAA